MSKARNSNIELLRIIAMMLIVLHHLCKYAYPGNASAEVETVCNLLLLGGKIGVDIFVLISGFFLASGRIKLASMLRVLFETWFYSLVLGLVCALLFQNNFSPKDFLKSFLPTNNGLPWFVTAYLGMYLVAPWLSKLSSALSQSQFKQMLVVGFCVFSLVPTLTGCMFVTNDFSWFCFLFLIACYICKFGFSTCIAKRMFVGGGLLLVASVFIGELICAEIPAVHDHITYFANMYTVPTLFASMGLFCIFNDLKIPTLKGINVIAQGSFGVYLIHENTFVRELLWQNFGFVFSGGIVSEVLLALSATICIYLVLTGVDLIRLQVFEKPLFGLLQDRFETFFNRSDAALNGITVVNK